MRKVYSLVIWFLFVHSLGITQPMGKGTLEGSVVNIEDRQPVVGANVLLQGTVLGTMTDAQGKFTFKHLLAGQYNLKVSMIGFKPRNVKVDVDENEVTNITIELEQSAIQTPPVIITANRREQSLQEVTNSVSVVSDQLLTRRNSITIDNALKYVPGVNITRSQVNIRGSTGYSHGVGTRVLMLVDGLPFLSGDTEEIIWESIPTNNIERIEVVKGSGSALYGSSALGGVINVITKSIQDRPETKMKFYGGIYSQPTYSNWQWTDEMRTLGGLYLSHQRRLGDFTIAAGGSRTLDDGYKRNDFWKRWNIWTRLSYDINPYESFGMSFSMLEQKRGNFLYWKDLNHAFEPKDEQLDDRVHSLRWNLNSSYKHILSSDFYYTVKLGLLRSSWEDNIPSTLYPSGSSSKSNSLIGEIQVNYQFLERHFFVGGITGNLNRVSAETIFGEHSAFGGALYVQDEIMASDNLRINIGGRYDQQKLEDTKSMNQFNPKFGIVFNPFSSLSLRGSIGRGFRTPSVAEVFTKTDVGGLVIMPNPNLKPERSWSYELGGSYIAADFFTADFSAFQNDFWDLIEPTFGNDGYIHFLNITRARVSGFETSINLRFLDNTLQNQISYIYIYPKDITKSDLLKYRSRHLCYISTDILLEPFQCGIDFRYLSKVERIDKEFVQLGIVPDGDNRVPIYVVDLHLSVDWKYSGISFRNSFHINNLLQYYYVELIGDMAPTRNFVLVLEARF